VDRPFRPCYDPVPKARVRARSARYNDLSCTFPKVSTVSVAPPAIPLVANHKDSLLARIRAKDVKVGVVGLGYVGLPLSLVFAEKGFSVLGFDSDATKPEVIARGASYIMHVPAVRIAAARDTGRFAATSDLSRLGEPDVLIICLPTPLTPQQDPDLSYVIRAAQEIRRVLKPCRLVVLESTTYPGTTDGLLKGILEESGLKCGMDFFLAFSPEREDPGNPELAISNTPKVVGGVDEAGGDLAQALYDQVVVRTVRVSSARTAEATKLMENIFRAVNIALVNELKMIYDRMGVDIWEVLDAAATKGHGFMRFNPGPGWGGHCIPVDPFYLSWKAREYGLQAKLIEVAGDVNIRMPEWVVGKLQRALNERGKALFGSKILLLGLAYKRDVADTRESPALVVMDLLEGLGAMVSFHDPHVPVIPATRHHSAIAGRKGVLLTAETVRAQDAVVVVTDHSGVDYEMVAREAPLVVDTRGVYRRLALGPGGRVLNA